RASLRVRARARWGIFPDHAGRKHQARCTALPLLLDHQPEPRLRTSPPLNDPCRDDGGSTREARSPRALFPPTQSSSEGPSRSAIRRTASGSLPSSRSPAIDGAVHHARETARTLTSGLRLDAVVFHMGRLLLRLRSECRSMATTWNRSPGCIHLTYFHCHL